MINRGLYALLLTTVLGTIASQLSGHSVFAIGEDLREGGGLAQRQIIETAIEADQKSNDTVMWQAIIHTVFLASALRRTDLRHQALTKRRASFNSKISCRSCAGVGSKPKRR